MYLSRKICRLLKKIKKRRTNLLIILLFEFLGRVSFVGRAKTEFWLPCECRGNLVMGVSNSMRKADSLTALFLGKSEGNGSRC
jgi:hypothetical protein